MSFKPHPFGKYFATERIATGGMAEILKAKSFGELGFEKDLALKKILPHLSTNQDFINMLIDEAKINVQLHHRNVIEVYDFGRVDDDYFIAMEFIDGVDLRTIMRRLDHLQRRLPVGASVYLVSEICKGLDYAHRKNDVKGKSLGIVHRDISPPNILVSWEGEVKIVDFGIAEATSKITETSVGILKGKLPYMSPEQAQGFDVDARTDIFSTGVILYELLTGQPLFDRDASSIKTLNRIRTFTISPPFLPPEVPGELELLLMRALQNQRKERYASAGDFHKDLMKFLYASPQDMESANLSLILKQIFQREIASSQELKERENVLQRDIKTQHAFASTTNYESLVQGAPSMLSSEPDSSSFHAASGKSITAMGTLEKTAATALPPPFKPIPPTNDQSSHSVHHFFDNPEEPEKPSEPKKKKTTIAASLRTKSDIYPFESLFLPQQEGLFDFQDDFESSYENFTPSQGPRRTLKRFQQRFSFHRDASDASLPARRSTRSRTWLLMVLLLLLVLLLLPDLPFSEHALTKRFERHGKTIFLKVSEFPFFQ